MTRYPHSLWLSWNFDIFRHSLSCWYLIFYKEFCCILKSKLPCKLLIFVGSSNQLPVQEQSSTENEEKFRIWILGRLFKLPVASTSLEIDSITYFKIFGIKIKVDFVKKKVWIFWMNIFNLNQLRKNSCQLKVWILCNEIV